MCMCAYITLCKLYDFQQHKYTICNLTILVMLNIINDDVSILKSDLSCTLLSLLKYKVFQVGFLYFDC